MNPAKRISAFIVSLTMVLTLVQIGASAETDLQSIADSIIAEMLTTDNEPARMVTKNLDWSLNGDIELPDGVSVTFESSDTSVIANDGSITRNSVYSLDTTVTATVSDGTDSVTKELQFTVLRSSISMHMSDGFYYPSLKDSEIIEYDSENSKYRSNLTDWVYAPHVTSSCEENASSKLICEEDGYAISYKRLNTAIGSQYDLYKKMNVSGENEDVLTLSTMLNVKDWGTSGTKRIDLLLFGHVSGGGDMKLVEIRFYSGSTALYTYENDTFASAGSVGSPNLSVATDKKVDIEINYASNTYRVLINGNQIGGTLKIPDYDLDYKISGLQIGMVRQVVSPGKFLIKDLCVYSDSASLLRYEELSNQSPNAITNNLSLPGFINGKAVIWSSSNENVVSIDGVVTRAADDTDVTVTASVDGEDDREFNFMVLGTRTSTKYWISSENFEEKDAYKTVWGTGAGIGNGVVIGTTDDTDSTISFEQILVNKSASEVTRALKLSRTEEQTSLRYGLATRWKSPYLNGIITLNAQLCFDFEAGETPVYAISFCERGNGGADQNYIYFDYSRNVVNINGRGYDVLPGKGEWFDIKVKFNMPRETVRVYLNGEDIIGRDMSLLDAGTHNYYVAASGQTPGFSGTYFNPQTANADMYIDNLSIYAINDDAVSESLASYGMIDYEGITPDEYAYSLAIVGDTQNITDSYPDSLDVLYKWIADNAEERKMKYVIGLGDIANRNTAAEFEIAKPAIENNLKGVVPYSLVRGNHDSVQLYNKYFKYEDIATENTGSMDGTMLNTYHKFRAGDVKYLILNLDFAPTDEMLEWANGVAEENPDRNIIVVTHCYLDRDGRPNDNLDADNSFQDGNNRGEDIWNKLVRKHENIVMVLSGHVDEDEIIVSERKGDSGNTVKQILIDPQTTDLAYKEAGAGLVAMFYFSEDGKDVKVEYYSTILDKYYRENNQFSMSLDLIDEPVKTVSITDENFAETVTCNAKLTGSVAYEYIVAALYSGNRLVSVKKYNAAVSVEVTFDENISGNRIEIFRFAGEKPYPVCEAAEKAR